MGLTNLGLILALGDLQILQGVTGFLGYVDVTVGGYEALDAVAFALRRWLVRFLVGTYTHGD